MALGENPILFTPQQEVLANRFKQAVGLSENEFNNFLVSDSDIVQREMAPKLRALATSHLESSDGVRAQRFRRRYSKVYPEDQSHQYLKRQANSGAWGSDIEAIALGEALGCHVVVTDQTDQRSTDYPLYRAQNKDAPTVHLYNQGNQHWHVGQSANTIGQGNCLYNAFSQALQTIFTADRPKTQNIEAPRALDTHRFFKAQPSAAKKQAPVSVSNHRTPKPAAVIDDVELKVAQSQQSILDALFKKTTTPDELETNIRQQKAAEEARLNQLTPEERKQISDDYALALQLAQEEVGVGRKIR